MDHLALTTDTGQGTAARGTNIILVFSLSPSSVDVDTADYASPLGYAAIVARQAPSTRCQDNPCRDLASLIEQAAILGSVEIRRKVLSLSEE